jgi:hypothetical protein
MILKTPQFFRTYGSSLEVQVENLLTEYKPEDVPVRLVFFGGIYGQYERVHKVISRFINQFFGQRPPVFSYIPQPSPEGFPLIMEATEMKVSAETNLLYRQWKNIPYIIAESTDYKALFIGGMRSGYSHGNVAEHAGHIFSSLKNLLYYERIQVGNILRQWNYIGQIINHNNYFKNYSAFNDARSDFYKYASWYYGYPAATAVGCISHQVKIDMEAIQTFSRRLKIIPVNNNLQVPAHEYSGQIVQNANTPKFERGKIVLFDGKGYMYISGTASIRGEKSIDSKNIIGQTLTTLENIENLLSRESLSEAGVQCNCTLSSMRVYIKDEKDYESARGIIEEKYPHVPAIYLQADVCRNELLIEIEGFAEIEIL